MIRMIPNSIAPEIKSNAEKKLFAMFRNSNSEEKIIILHSLGVAEHSNNIFGEIDFVIICREGLLCVEVKGGAVERTDADWVFTNRFGIRTVKHEGPFVQVQGNMHSLRNYMKKRLGNFDNIVRAQYASCVVMPDCSFDNYGIDIIREVLFDNKCSLSPDNIISRSFHYWRDRCSHQHGFTGGCLSEKEIDRAAELLRGDFRFVPSLRDQVERTMSELHALTEEQYLILESLSENERILISGMAGTGKTLLAAEQCRRAYWENKTVLYLCFNHNMAQFVKNHFKCDSVDIDVFTLHSLMMASCGEEWTPDMDASYYSKVLPEKFLSPGVQSSQLYDLVVIDEGQDLINSVYLQCINKILVNGIEKGQWSIYYDSNQNLFNPDSALCEAMSGLKRLGVTFSLSVNCRNTKQIANANTLVSNIPQVCRIKASGPEVETMKYSSLKEELSMVISLIQRLKSEKINMGDIVLLSAYSADNPRSCLSVRSISSDVGKIKFDRDLWKAGKNELRFSTIAAFKGLESKVVIILDVDAFSDESRRLLNYVAISRACAALYIFYDCAVEVERQKMLSSGYLQLSGATAAEASVHV